MNVKNIIKSHLFLSIIMVSLSACHIIPESNSPNIYDWLKVENKPNCQIAIVRVWALNPGKDYEETFAANNKAAWTGDCLDGKAHGEGKLVRRIKNGKEWLTLTYEGDIRHGIRHGYGKEIWPRGQTYVGDYAQGVWSGHGTYTRPDGYSYSGSWRYSVMHGLGVKTLPGGIKIETYWYGGNIKDGWAKITLPNGDQYDGDFIDQSINGEGVFLFANGDECEASWENGSITGAGRGKKQNRWMKCFGKIDLKARTSAVYFEDY